MRYYNTKESTSYSNQSALYSRILEAALNAKDSAIGGLERGLSKIKNVAKTRLDRFRENIELMHLLMKYDLAYATDGRDRLRRNDSQYEKPIGLVHYAKSKKSGDAELDQRSIELARIQRLIQSGKKYSADTFRKLKKQKSRSKKKKRR